MTAITTSGAGSRPEAGSEAADTRTLDRAEVERFGRMAAEWWDPAGKFRPLHQIGPARLAFLRREILAHFGLRGEGMRPLRGLAILDVGCGGGLIAEPLARLGARVTAIDPSKDTIEAARAHAAPQGLDIDYRAARTEDLVAAGYTFEAVSCLEVLEHVPDPAAFLSTAARLVRPGGLMLLSTLNRTLKSYALAIVGAEYVLGWLPRGTHQWNRFITPDELDRHVRAAGLVPGAVEGIVYDPLRDRWSLSDDTGVNYLTAARKPAASL